MKKVLCSKWLVSFMVLIVSTNGILTAQTPQYFNTGTSSGASLPFGTKVNNKAQWIYTPTQFSPTTVSGYITDVYMKTSNAVTNTTYSDLTIKLGYTSLSNFNPGTFETGLVTYYYASSLLISTTVNGWLKFTLPTPFYYNGVQNFIVEGSQTNYTGTGFSVLQVATGTDIKLSGSVTSSTAATGQGLMNFGFDLVTATACTSPPTPGRVTSNSYNACNPSENFILSLDGTSSGVGQTYQWQSSPNNSTWANITGATDVSWTGTQPASTYYRCNITCGASTVPTPGLLISSSILAGGNYVINKNIPTGGGNFQTFGDAVTALKCGITGPVTFTVAAGTGPYNEQITIPAISGASPTSPVTFKGNMDTLAFTAEIANKRAGITLDGANYIIIDSLIIDGTAGTYGWGVHMTNQADFNRVSNCTINVSNTNTTLGNHAPIVFSGATSSLTTSGNNGNYDTIIGNTLNGGYYGIVVYGNTAANSQNQGNVVQGNKITDTYSYAIYLAYQSGALISGNEISRPVRATSGSTAGVYLTAGNLNTLVEKNRIHNMFDAMPTNGSFFYGVYISSSGQGGQSNRIINNLVYNVGGNGSAYGIYNASASEMDAYHNTFVFNDQDATTGQCFGIYQNGIAYGINIINNIVSVSRSGNGLKRCLHFSSTGSSIVSNNNVLYMNAAAGFDNKTGQYGATSFGPMAMWQGANFGTFDQQSISADPLFINSATGNYTPQEATIDAIGTNLGITTDILNNPRSATPDPGAYEFTAPLPVTLVNFNGEKQGNINKLTWTTSTEINNAGFELERSADGRNFSKLVFVASQGDNGNSNRNLIYNYNDERPLAGNGYYRLKQIDKDGKFSYSNIVLIKGSKLKDVMITSLYPNPADKEINLVISSPSSEKVTLVITDMAGKIISQTNMQVMTGDNFQKLPVGQLSSGTYFIKTICANGCESQVQKFVKQ